MFYFSKYSQKYLLKKILVENTCQNILKSTRRILLTLKSNVQKQVKK